MTKGRIPNIAALLALGGGFAHGALPEVDTVFYGRVLHLGGGEEHVVTEGQLSWQIGQGGSAVLERDASLSPMKGGEMSYQLRVPQHKVIADTLPNAIPGLPIPASESGLPFQNTAITLDGMSLRLADPSGFLLNLYSGERAEFRRLDLIFDGDLPDADGDGLPDWWEDKYGTDGQLADAGGDPDGDGVGNLAEYLRGTSPTGSDQQPKLASELFVSIPLGGAAVPFFQAIDADSEGEDLIYTIAGVPDELRVERVGDSEAVTSFTQADIDAGEIVVRHVGAAVSQTAFSISLRDETAAHPAAVSTVRVSAAEAETLWAGWALPMEVMPGALPAIQDATLAPAAVTMRAPTSGESAIMPEDIGRLYIGSSAGDEMLGSNKDDWFVPGEGDRVQPGGGSDTVVVMAEMVTLAEFVPGEDVIDLRGVLEAVPERRLSDYIQLANNILRIDADGDGSGFDDGTIIFEQSAPLPELADLWDFGSLETGSILPRTTLFADVAGSLAEEGLSEVVFTVRRRGDDSAALTVPLSYSGTATMGLDYANLPSSIFFPAGEKLLTLMVTPFADDEREPTETVLIEFGTGDDWEVASGDQTVALPLLDLPSRVWLEVAERIAIQDGQIPAQLIVRRSGPLGAPLTARLGVGGQATPFVDYARLPASVTFAPAQEVITIDITPTASGNLQNGAETVSVSVAPDSSYLTGATPDAHFVIVAGATTIDGWMAENGVEDDRVTFLQSDGDKDGTSGLAEFAYGGDASGFDRASTAMPVRAADGRFGIRFRRWPFAPELNYAVQRSTSLSEWSELQADEFEEIPGPVLPGGIQEVTILLNDVEAGAVGLRVAVTGG